MREVVGDHLEPLRRDAVDHDPVGIHEMIDGGDVEALGEARLVAQERRDLVPARARST